MTKIQFRCAALARAIGLIAMLGGAVLPVLAQDQPVLSAAEFEQLYSRGQGGYLSNCSSCHGVAADGNAAPALAGNDLLSDTNEVIDTVLHGYSYMPPFGDILSDEQASAVLTYIRNSWGNEYGIVTPEEVAARR